ncbi:hypothetical protein C0J52_22258 [Blattella germanica]|nr:hypothetical protein C0J52_22258 [Blattella germanica]
MQVAVLSPTQRKQYYSIKEQRVKLRTRVRIEACERRFKYGGAWAMPTSTDTTAASPGESPTPTYRPYTPTTARDAVDTEGLIGGLFLTILFAYDTTAIVTSNIIDQLTPKLNYLFRLKLNLGNCSVNKNSSRMSYKGNQTGRTNSVSLPSQAHGITKANSLQRVQNCFKRITNKEDESAEHSRFRDTLGYSGETAMLVCPPVSLQEIQTYETDIT